MRVESAKSTYSTIISFTTPGVCGYMQAYEPNETMATAAQIGTGTAISAGIPTNSDQDWYKFSNNGQNKKIKVELYNLPADYDMVLYNSSGTVVGESHNTGLTDEKILYNVGKVGTYYIHVYGVPGAYNAEDCYSLKVSLSSINFTSQTDGSDPQEPDTSAFFRVYPNPMRGVLNMEYNSIEEGQLTIRIFNAIGSILVFENKTFVKGLNTYSFETGWLKKGLYLLELNNGKESKIEKLMVE